MKTEYLKLNNEDIHIKCYAIVQGLNCYLKEKESKKVRNTERNRERGRGRKKERRKEGRKGGRKGRNLPKTVISEYFKFKYYVANIFGSFVRICQKNSAL